MMVWCIFFSVDKKERENGKDPEMECVEDGFHDYQRPYVENYKLVHGPQPVGEPIRMWNRLREFFYIMKVISSERHGVSNHW